MICAKSFRRTTGPISSNKCSGMSDAALLQRCLDELIDGSKLDYVGLWEVCAAIDDHFPKDVDLQQLTLSLVEVMLKHGFVSGNLNREEPGFVPWADQSDSYVLARIRAEWDELDRRPDINDIAWFRRDILG